MTTLIALAHKMESYNHAVTSDSKCVAWQKFIEECRDDLHRFLCSDDAGDFVPEGFWDYWSCVAAGESLDFDPKSGDEVSRA